MIRSVTAADAAALAHIDASEPDGWTTGAIASSLARPVGFGWLVAPARGFAVATSVADEGELLRIVVAPADRRKGLASQLLARCEALWRDHEVVRAFLEVRTDNAPARALYARHGWRGVGRRTAYYADGTDALVLEWTNLQISGPVGT